MESIRVREERWNALTHALGAALSAVGLALLLQRAALLGNPAYTFSSAVYAVSFCLLYISSALLHSARSEQWIARFERLDHAAIFIAMAGSYTPFLIYTFPGALGWSLLSAVWGMAFGGICCIRWIIRQFMPWGMLYYLAMGLFILFLIPPLKAHMAPAGMSLLLGGGALYCLGLLFFLWRSLRYHHVIWHLFVLAGSGCHFIAVYSCLAPKPPLG